MANSMQTAWRYFGTPAMHFRSGELINVIFEKTAVTPSLFKLKTSNQNSNYSGHRISSIPGQYQDIFVQKMAEKLEASD